MTPLLPLDLLHHITEIFLHIIKPQSQSREITLHLIPHTPLLTADLSCREVAAPMDGSSATEVNIWNEEDILGGGRGR